MNVLSLAGVALLSWVVWFALGQELDKGIPFEQYIQASGMAIVVGGAFGAGFLKSSTNDFKAAWSLLPRAFTNPIPSRVLIDQLVEFADIARKNGLIALESQQIKHKFMAKAIQLLVDGQKPAVITKTLEAESDAQSQREKHGTTYWSYMGEVSPAMGMVGTLVGLVSLLADMSSQEKLTSGMSTALLTTLYGAMLANMIFLPIAAKMRVQSEVEALNREIIIEGVAFIQTGGNPRVLADLLASFVTPDEAQKLAINSR